MKKRHPLQRLALIALAALMLVSMSVTAYAQAEDDMSKKVTLSWYKQDMMTVDEEGFMIKDIEETMNIDLVLTRVDSNNAEQLALMFASDTLPDVGSYPRDINFMHYQQELCRTIPLALVREYAPTYAKVYDENPIAWAYATTKEDPEQLYCMPVVTETYSKLYLFCDFYRYDWILEAGIDPGVSVKKISDTLYIAEGGIPLDKQEEILLAFSKKCAAPATWAGTGAQRQLLSGFGLISDVVDNNGKAEYYFSTERYKEYLKYLQRLYKQNLIDKEFITNTGAITWEKVTNGMSGYFLSSTNALNTWAYQRPPLTLLNTGVPLLMTPGLADAEGNYMTYAGTVVPLWNNNSIYVNRDVDDAKLIRILKFLEYSVFFGGDPDKQMSGSFGEKGIDWIPDPDRPGFPKVLNPIAFGQKGIGAFASMQTGDMWKWATIEPLFEAGAEYYVKSYGGIWNEHNKFPYKNDFNSETNLAAVRAEYWTPIDTLVKEYLADAIMGNVDVDATWDNYLKNLDAYGYQKILEEVEKAPIVDEVIAMYSK